jgi:transposase-like protein
MKRIRHSPEQIIRKLREADAELAKGAAIPEVCKALGIAENTYYRWRNQVGGIKADEMKRLKDLEKENARPKALVADLALDKAILNTPTTTLQRTPRGALSKRARPHPIDDPDRLPVDLHPTDQSPDDPATRLPVRLI